MAASGSSRRIATSTELSTITRQTRLFVIEKRVVIERSILLRQVDCAIATDGKKPLGEPVPFRPLDANEPFAKRRGHGGGHALAGQRGELAGELVCVVILDVQAHLSTS